VDADRRAWCERVAKAARRAADELRELDDPYCRVLLADLDGLRERLSAELSANNSDA
jgi:signal transduction protein with GAF and PtsI domain